jgi:hypothetical protein
MQSQAMQGMVQAQNQLARDIRKVAEGDLGVDRVVSVKESSFIYSMNIQLLKISDDMVGQVLDLLA